MDGNLYTSLQIVAQQNQAEIWFIHRRLI